MSLTLAAIFWGGLAAAVYSYAAFPALAAVVGAGKRRLPASNRNLDEPNAVTIIIPAYNEERHLETKIRNTLSGNYPQDLLEVLVVSDASTDRTNEIAAGFEDAGVRLIVQERRRGKTAGLNRAMTVATGSLVVFTDANAIYPADAIENLVAYFDDPRVGLVSGYTKYTSSTNNETTEGTNVYTSLERVIKRTESLWGCCVGADGAIFAMRRSLYRTLRDDDINDFVLPLVVIDSGYRCLLAEDAYCLESPGQNLQSEFRRQSRITNRTIRAIWRHKRLLNPIQFPAFSFFLFSHKLLRLLAPVLLIASTMALVFLVPTGGVYPWLAGMAMIPALSLVLERAKPSLLSSGGLGRFRRVLNMLVVTNLAILHGWWRFVLRDSETTWQPDRAVQAGE
jgi:cellulose synthase/poly-beta-1,6-N-acetylglucosamine synthase-like glycosyltransferase